VFSSSLSLFNIFTVIDLYSRIFKSFIDESTNLYGSCRERKSLQFICMFCLLQMFLVKQISLKQHKSYKRTYTRNVSNTIIFVVIKIQSKHFIYGLIFNIHVYCIVLTTILTCALPPFSISVCN
jgi:hypothetical protein